MQDLPRPTDDCQTKFSPCWCETRPNNPNCDGVVPLPIENNYLEILIILLITTIIYKYKILNI